MAGYWKSESGGSRRLDSWIVPRVILAHHHQPSEVTGLPPDEEEAATEQRAAKTWLQDAATPGGVSTDKWRVWWRGNTLFHELVELALRKSLFPTGSQVTQLLVQGVRAENLRSPDLQSTDIAPHQRLLTECSGWAVSREMPPESRKAWTCVYSTRRDGRSWSTFQASIESKGALLLVVKEKQHNTFGAYIDSEIKKGPSWHGNSQNFLFGNGVVYRTTGFNDHYQYFNYGKETLPNGLGVGGQLGHFGLWIDCGFVLGSSSPAATFASPRLSAQSDFTIDAVEVWLVRPSKLFDGASIAGGAPSVVETHAEAAALLELANRPMYSRNNI
ncbi:hypothetical protein H4R26_001230 [Coemansia thaxteri]|uniref:MTOR-associated protein MEAK7 n=1 Tax=Coemansia thaxteri TaxID=2663907 RepID=A0A9W8BNB8_9FUNG|nr:hypothetical protein H4R26_001230 [Coemansia thaxteri]